MSRGLIGGRGLLSMTLACCVAGLMSGLMAGCAGTTPKSSTSPDEGNERPSVGEVDSEAVSEIDATEAAKQAAAQEVLKKVKDRDPEEERKKLENSKKISRNAAQKLASNKLGEAIKTAREALKVHEQNVDAMLVIAEAYYKEGKYELVRAVTSSALQVDAKIRTPGETSRAYNLQGFAMLAMGESGQATQLFKKAAEADEGNAAAWNNLGTRYLDAGDVGTAVACFQYAIELDPRFHKAQLNYGAALRAERKWAEAEAAMQKALELRPGYAEAFFNLGVLYLDADPFPGLETTQRLTKAITNLRKYQQLAVGDGVSGPKRAKHGATPGAAKNPPPRVSKARADDYIRLANKGLEKEARAQDRAKEREAKDAEAAAAAAAEAAADTDAPTQGVASDEPAETDGPAPESPGAPTPQGPATQGPATESPQPTEPAQPEPSQPEPSKPEPSKPEPSKPEPAKPAPSKPQPTEPSKPAPSKPEPSKPEPSKPAPSKPEASKPEPSKPAPSEPSKPAPTKPAPQGPSAPAPSKPAPVQPQKPAPQKPQSASTDLSGYDKKIAVNPAERGTRSARATLIPMGADVANARVDQCPRPNSFDPRSCRAMSARGSTTASPRVSWSELRAGPVSTESLPIVGA